MVGSQAPNTIAAMLKGNMIAMTVMSTGKCGQRYMAGRVEGGRGLH